MGARPSHPSRCRMAAGPLPRPQARSVRERRVAGGGLRSGTCPEVQVSAAERALVPRARSAALPAGSPAPSRRRSSRPGERRNFRGSGGSELSSHLRFGDSMPDPGEPAVMVGEVGRRRSGRAGSQPWTTSRAPGASRALPNAQHRRGGGRVPSGSGGVDSQRPGRKPGRRGSSSTPADPQRMLAGTRSNANVSPGSRRAPRHRCSTGARARRTHGS
jgi:hypothetical protein